ncbi:CinA family protein [Mucilaginibacter sp. KACC 22063]|uniref:CinA family protein n=1 Tax=Mucilaginibacter sp. KACC 22063 TaxID=3025666 RepID=UPI002365B2BC|nr:CinA family protein [Mucilaginibacter sp. KACC 22063]WDF54161.1 CinA family protein [Mucilaginibacter sp. KACC 22063]
MAEKYINDCAKLLAERKLTIAFAESATAGWLCSEFALAEDSGKVLKGGLVCYDASLKEKILGIPHELIEQYTPESKEVTEELAKRLGNLIEADIHVGVTGLTSAGGSETEEKPVGTIFLAVLVKGKMTSERYIFDGECEDIIHKAIQAAAALITKAVSP